jgi:hypothetical protein
MSSRTASQSRPLARLGAVLVALVAAALLFGLAAHHDDVSNAPASGPTAESLEAGAIVSASQATPGSDELLMCSLAVLCCVAFLARRRRPRRVTCVGRATPSLALPPLLPRSAHPRQALPLEILSISRT